MLYPLYRVTRCLPVTLLSVILLCSLSASADSQTSCSNGRTLLGLVESVDIDTPVVVTLSAMLDTGATNSAINARNIKIIPNSQEADQVSFQIQNHRGQWISMVKPLTRYAWIQTHSGRPVKKPVVHLSIRLGSVKSTNEFYLLNRSPFKHPVLLGRSFLNQRVIVDVSQQYLASSRPKTLALV